MIAGYAPHDPWMHGTYLFSIIVPHYGKTILSAENFVPRFVDEIWFKLQVYEKEAEFEITSVLYFLWYMRRNKDEVMLWIEWCQVC